MSSQQDESVTSVHDVKKTGKDVNHCDKVCDKDTAVHSSGASTARSDVSEDYDNATLTNKKSPGASKCYEEETLKRSKSASPRVGGGGRLVAARGGSRGGASGARGKSVSPRGKASVSGDIRASTSSPRTVRPAATIGRTVNSPRGGPTKTAVNKGKDVNANTGAKTSSKTRLADNQNNVKC